MIKESTLSYIGWGGNNYCMKKKREWSNSETSMVFGSELKGENDKNGITTWDEERK